MSISFAQLFAEYVKIGALDIAMNTEVKGLSRLDRARLSEIYRGTKGTVDVSDVCRLLGVSRPAAGKMLSRWASKGWLARVRRGIYVPVPLEAKTSDVALEDSWVVAARLFEPCYIGGWSAAEYWDLTEQIFRTVVVMTTQRPRIRQTTIRGTDFRLRTVSQNALFGLSVVWRGRVKVCVSNPTRTILDFLVDPRLGGGIRSSVDMLKNYLQSDQQNLNLLIEYGARLGKGVVFKRLGFLIEQLMPERVQVIEQCRARLTQGNTKLDPKLPANRLITRWRLWVPENWSVG